MKKALKSKIQYFLIALIASLLFGLSTIVDAFAHTQEEMNACIDNQEGDSCSFNNENGETVNGQCAGESASGEGSLYCNPTR